VVPRGRCGAWGPDHCTARRRDRRRLPRFTVYNEIFSTEDEQVAPLDPLPCPITLAWSEKDALLPVAFYGPIARERLPRATFTILPDVGHDPMMDDPALVARTILDVTGVSG
jgi:pimeloyl-ACP methyl ester carboxylesterase